MTFALHVCKVGAFEYSSDDAPNPAEARRHIHPWLSAVYQSEHLALLVGNGLTTAVALAAGQRPVGMNSVRFGSDFDEIIDRSAETSAARMNRGTANFEDQIRAANQLLDGLRMIAPQKAGPIEQALSAALRNLVESVLATEAGIRNASDTATINGVEAKRLLMTFLLSFANRSGSRDRLNIFTTNYDRLVEYGCDWTGLRCIDRFVGTLTPVFRASRLDVDFHYSPPGIRGEPRYLDGVVRLTKLHGSIDWKNEYRIVRRYAIPFGSAATHPDLPKEAEQMLIYPNAAKDIETAEYPYAELFRDFSAALCRPNSALVTYGYGFGDDHINRILRDMLTLPSTHMVIIAYDDAGQRISRFCEASGHSSQISLLIGSHFGGLDTLTTHYLPQSSLKPRVESGPSNSDPGPGAGSE